MDLWGSSNLGGGGSSTATLPDQISNLACTGGTDGTAGTIDVSFNEVTATSFDLLKYYILIYKVGGIPQTPFDGTRITLQKGTADAKLEHQITGLTFDQLYGVRVYPVSVKNQFQTLAEGATATVTPVAGIRLDSLMADVDVDRIKGIENDPEVQFLVLKHNYEDQGSTLVHRVTPYGVTIIWNSPYNTYSSSNADSKLNNDYINEIKTGILSTIPNIDIEYTPGNSNYNIASLSRKFFLLSMNEYQTTRTGVNKEGSEIPYFSTNDKKAGDGARWTRSPSSSVDSDLGESNIPNRVVGFIDSGGEGKLASCSTRHFNICPAFCLPADMLFNPIPDADGSYVPI